MSFHSKEKLGDSQFLRPKSGHPKEGQVVPHLCRSTTKGPSNGSPGVLLVATGLASQVSSTWEGFWHTFCRDTPAKPTCARFTSTEKTAYSQFFVERKTTDLASRVHKSSPKADPPQPYPMFKATIFDKGPSKWLPGELQSHDPRQGSLHMAFQANKEHDSNQIPVV